MCLYKAFIPQAFICKASFEKNMNNLNVIETYFDSE